MNFNLDKKVCVITGGTGVLGKGFSRGLAEAGGRVAVLGRRMDAAEAIVAEIKSKGGEAMAVRADVLDKKALLDARDKVIGQWGGIDILINGAGGNLPGAVVPPDRSFTELAVEEFRKVVDLNLTGTLLPTQIFSEPMIEKRKGCIINISSMSALTPLTRVAGYSAAKAAVSNFTGWLAVEYATKYGEGIRVNAIAPGFFLTEQNRTLLTNPDGSLTLRGKQIIAGTPFGRFGQPEELVGTLIWLCSDAAAFVTGVVVPVDGGYNAYSGV